jgi:hypothetical protein
MIKNDGETEQFQEVTSRVKTLYLFPIQEIGALLYRDNILVTDEEYNDLSYLYPV